MGAAISPAGIDGGVRDGLRCRATPRQSSSSYYHHHHHHHHRDRKQHRHRHQRQGLAIQESRVRGSRRRHAVRPKQLVDHSGATFVPMGASCPGHHTFRSSPWALPTTRRSRRCDRIRPVVLAQADLATIRSVHHPFRQHRCQAPVLVPAPAPD